MVTYVCKCGRQVQKAASADNTGNRDTAGCTGCPYLLPWGPDKYIEGQGYTKDVQGYECRMSPTISYATTYLGQANDKCTLHILSLDLDFLDTVQAWIDDHAADMLSAGFSRGSMRGTDFSNKGRYSLSISCAQNKKGMAAKAALLERFFTGGRVRKDMTLAQEKAHILAAIKKGKENASKMNYIISQHDNGLLYAYHLGTFWFWLADKRWVPSDFAAQEYEKAQQKNPRITPEEFMDSGDFMQMDDYEVPSQKLAALEALTPADRTASAPDAPQNPTPAAAASRADAGAAGQSLCAAGPASLEAPPSGPLAFDYSGLDGQTVADLHLAEREVAGGKRMAEMGLRRMADGVAIAHDALCGSCDKMSQLKHGNRGEASFGRWCESVGLNRKAAERLLQVSKLFDNSSPRQQKVLEELGPTLLYAAAKPSAPPELVQAVKDGDITTHKQYQEALARIRTLENQNASLLHSYETERGKADAADRRAEEESRKRKEANEGYAAVMETLRQAQEDAANADARARAAEHDRDEARKERDGARDALQAVKLRGDRLKAENDDLKARPIEAAVVDEDELDRRVEERVRRQMADREADRQQQAARNAEDAILLLGRQINTAWQMVRPFLAEMEENSRVDAVDRINKQWAQTQKEIMSCL